MNNLKNEFDDDVDRIKKAEKTCFKLQLRKVVMKTVEGKKDNDRRLMTRNLS